jgi:hypothetical protein
MRAPALWLLTTLGCATASTGAGAPPAPPLEVGFAEVEITPPLGYPMAGYSFVQNARLATAVRDPLHAKAMVLVQGGAGAALVIADVASVPSALSARARARAAEATGIPAAHIAVTATHTHTGPALEQVPGAIDYPSLFVDRIVEAVRQAHAARRPSDLRAGTAVQEPQVSFQRRNRFQDGKVRTVGPTVRHLAGYEPESFVAPAGPIDPGLGLLLVRDAGKPAVRGVLSVFALHLNTVGDTRVGETVWSADVAHYLDRDVRRALGADVHSVFGAGTCGNINYVDPRVRSTRTTEEIGGLLARTLVAAAHDLPAAGPGALAVKTMHFDASLRRFTDGQIAEARKDVQRYDQLSFLRRTEAMTMVSVESSPRRSLPIEVQAIRLTRNVAIVTLPGEVFVEHGLAIKRASPFPTTLVIELANDGGPGYVPTRQAFGEGDYEVLAARLEPGTGERMADEALRLLHDLAPAR